MTATTSESEPAGRSAPGRSVPQVILDTLRQALGPQDGTIALHEPQFAAREWEYLKDCLDSTFVSSVGAYVDRFEAALAAYAEVDHAVAVVNGTAALHVALMLVGVERDDEVLLPALTFVGTANAVGYIGAVPHFADCDATTLGLDPEKLSRHLSQIAEIQQDGTCKNRQTGRRIAAVLPVHVFGHPVDMDALSGVAAQYGLPVVEDAAESLGSRYKGRMTGGLSTVAALSFNGNKVVTTGGGGALLTNDGVLARAAKHLTTTAKQPHRWSFEHDQLGYNYRMPNLNAALGCAQLEQLTAFIAAKRRLASRYQTLFSGVDGVSVVTEPAFAESNYWLNALLLDEDKAGLRDEILERTNDAGIMTRPAWTPMHHLPMFSACPRMDLSMTESLVRRLINIPSSAILGQRHPGNDK